MTSDRPSDLHPDLTDERLEQLSAIFCRVRSGVHRDMRYGEGDDARVFGYTSFVRTCFAIEKVAGAAPWLRVIGNGKGEHFVFRIGAVPVRVYSGDPSEPVARWLAREGDELAAHQAAFGFPGFEYLLWMLRFTVKTDLTTGETSVSLVRLSESGTLLDSWLIRTPQLEEVRASADADVVPLAEQRPGLDIRSPVVEDPTDTETGPARAHGDK
jgi:hypothetical protein